MTALGKQETGTTPAETSVMALLGVAWFVACADHPNISVGGLSVKLAFLVFPMYALLFFKQWFLFKFDTAKLLCLLVFAAFLPSVAFSTSRNTSIAFLVGLVVCIIAMFSVASIVRMLGTRAFDVLFLFFRGAIIVSVLLRLSGLQERAHFIFYEPSYLAIGLIPYFCLVFDRFFRGGVRASAFDLVLIVLIVVASSSVSMVGWIVFSFFAMCFWLGRFRWSLVPIFFTAITLFVFAAYQSNERVQTIVSNAVDVAGDASQLPNALVFVAGNRIQRTMVAWEVLSDHPFFGVGPGALKAFASGNLSSDDFDFEGVSATDFDVELNATNVYLEIAAEVGSFGLITYLLLLVFLLRRPGQAVIPLKAALLVSMIALLVESSYLRPYMWVLYGAILGLSDEADAVQAGAAASPARPS